MEGQFEEKYTTIFLGNGMNPTQLVLLKRGPEAKIGPNSYNGLGGKNDPEDKTQYDCAVRELAEESGITKVPLIEFARVIINRRRLVSYYYGVINLYPTPRCIEGKRTGELEWVPLQLVPHKRFMSATQSLIHEWEKRNWRTDKLFTIYFERADIEDYFGIATKNDVKDGLHF